MICPVGWAFFLGVSMSRTETRGVVRMMKFMSVFGRYEASELSQLEAAELLGMSERTFYRRLKALGLS